MKYEVVKKTATRWVVMVWKSCDGWQEWEPVANVVLDDDGQYWPETVKWHETGYSTERLGRAYPTLAGAVRRLVDPVKEMFT